MDKALKQRLVGASVLIALAIVVLPMLLSGQPDNQQEARSIEVPPKPSELSFETRRFPLGGQSDGQPSIVEPPAEEPADTVTSVGDELQSQSGSDPSPAPVQTTTVPPSDSSPKQEAPKVQNEAQNEDTEQPGRYLVQVASFSTGSNANRLAERLRADGMSVLMDSIEAAVGTLHRVRVGPFDHVSGANEAMAQIRARTPDVNPRIIDLRPDETSPVTDPADPLTRWVVQVGSFSEPANAENLVAQLKLAGFTAYSLTVTESSGTRYKVRVGPEIERQSAVRVAGEIRSKLDLDGIVMTSD